MSCIAPVASENDEHVALAGYLRTLIGEPGVTNPDGVFWMSIESRNLSRVPYANKKTGETRYWSPEGVRRQKVGCVAGMPDVFVRHWQRTLWPELKRVKGGRKEQEQKKRHDELRKLGDVVAFCAGASAAIAWLRDQGVPMRNFY